MTYPPALPKWEGGWSVDGYDESPRREIGLRMVLASPSWGRRERGLSSAEFDSRMSMSAFAPIKSLVKFWNYDTVLDFHAKGTASQLAEEALL